MLLSDELKSSTIGNIRSGYCDTRPLEEDRERERGKERGREREGEREKESGEGGREEREGERKEGGRDEVREVERRIIQINCLLTYKCEKFLQFSTVSNFYQIRSQLKILRKGNNILTNEHQKNEDVCVCARIYSQGPRILLLRDIPGLHNPVLGPVFLQSTYKYGLMRSIPVLSLLKARRSHAVSPYLGPVNNSQLFILKWCDLNHTTVCFLCIFLRAYFSTIYMYLPC